MAGHSKFKNIMHRKGQQDAFRSRMFAKLSREISIASKVGGVDPNSNPRLRLAIQSAKSQSMPKENIQRAVNKGGGSSSEDYFEIRYEGYGPGGVAILVEALTDNRNRSAGNIRTYFVKHGGQMSETGSVGFMFDRVGEIRYSTAVGSEERIMKAVMEVGANDMETNEKEYTIICNCELLSTMSITLEDILGEAKSVRVTWKPKNRVSISQEKEDLLMKLFEALQDDDDVQNIYSNFEIDKYPYPNLV
ncbi:YebC/PmpR family DNA-binding transcriptional regulator [Candidatus Endowatersipora endosymbiont of Watersipora subatra]|uniref:YebC/PmpR family DNA-binding transcriptional regulator n=1 Tax=Candidatus Endowatersipora endosymbiont of Watersipora subatra TaxID=3077946 RepID=UPI00312C7494